MRNLFLVLLFSPCFHQLTVACTCASSSFCETSAAADLVVVVSIRESFDDLNAVEVKIEDHWRGKEPNNSRFRVFAGPWADLCGPNPRIMKEGEQWVLALFKVTKDTHPNGSVEEGQFFLPVCSNSLLEINGGRIEGRIYESNEIEEISLKQLERKLKECSFPKVDIGQIPGGLEISTYFPQEEGNFGESWEVILRDLHGREIHRMTALKEEFRLTIATEGLPKGIYLLQIYLDGNTRIYKGVLGRPL